MWEDTLVETFREVDSRTNLPCTYLTNNLSHTQLPTNSPPNNGYWFGNLYGGTRRPAGVGCWWQEHCPGDAASHLYQMSIMTKTVLRSQGRLRHPGLRSTPTSTDQEPTPPTLPPFPRMNARPWERRLTPVSLKHLNPRARLYSSCIGHLLTFCEPSLFGLLELLFLRHWLRP